MSALSNSTTILSQPPNFTGVSDYGRNNYERFFEYTDDNNISQYSHCFASLENLAELARGTRNVIDLARLNISDHGVGNQWGLNRLSEVKQKLAKAIEIKRSYYDNNLFGVVTKYVLMLFGKWNNGDTADIVAAEDFLLLWDSRNPVYKISHPDNRNYGKYCNRLDFRTSDLDTSQYYNYNPKRLIEMENGQQINYAALRA
jgi:hypothetical protein